ncbi:hypothetical protein FS837_004170 [Tulasnella sp. UAMH 9824]|nr:hypothetical protein FS837_004170 [Tulasnella sp. UAMH 9824]
MDDALLWYSELDNVTRNDWTKLRSAFLRRYATAGPSSTAVTPQPTVHVIRPARWSIFGSRKPPEIKKGRIEIFLKEHAKTLGFIAYDKNLATFSIVQDPAKAQVVSIPKHKKKARLHMQMEGLRTIDQYPYIGLALKNHDGDTSHIIPPPLPVNLYGNLDYLKPSSLCQRDPDQGWARAETPIATWAFRACTETKVREDQ